MRSGKQNAHVRRRVYSTADHITAVTAMKRVNPEHPMSHASYDAARLALGCDVKDKTLQRWLVDYGPQVEAAQPSLAVQPVDVNAVVAKAEKTLSRRLNKVLDKSLGLLETGDKLEGASARDLAIITGISIDQILKVNKISAEMVERVVRLNNLAFQLGRDALDLIDDYLDILQAEVTASNTTTTAPSPFTVDATPIASDDKR